MPRPVVPILVPLEAASSRARSSWPWIGRMRDVFSAIISVSGVIVTPCSRIFAISSIRCHGSSTTPLPITDSLPSRTTPEGNALSL